MTPSSDAVGTVALEPETLPVVALNVRMAEDQVRRFFVALLWGTARALIAQELRWSNWRRHHQALAKFFHRKSRHAPADLPL